MCISPILAGHRVGNYEIEREIGQGLYEATHRVLPRRALIKIGRGATALQLMREACILEALQHQGVVRVFESGVTSDKRPWLALELVGGETLATVLERGPLAAVEVLRLAAGIAEILEHAHRRGVIHRGLRPDRIAITGRRICIADWSEARTHDASTRMSPCTCRSTSTRCAQRRSSRSRSSRVTPRSLPMCSPASAGR